MTRTSFAERDQTRTSSGVGGNEETARRLAWIGFGVITVLFTSPIWTYAVVRNAGQPTPSAGGLLFALMTYTFPLVGILILSRLPRNTIGWILLLIGFSWGLSVALDSVTQYALATENDPMAALWDAVGGWLWVPGVGIMGTFLILLFPDGRLPSPRWKIVGWLAFFSMAATSLAITFVPGPMDNTTTFENPLGIESLRGLFSILIVSIVVIPMCIVASAVSLVMRFRRSHGVERLQLKWVTAGTAVVAILYAVAMGASLNAPWGKADTPPFASIAQTLAGASFFLIPASIGIAILKHRLFDIDVVINKAVVYGSLAAFITAVYVAIVAGAGALLGAAGESNLALSIFATAVVAVAFQPVRERVQRFANRLVYGKRATPYEVLTRFSETIASSFGAENLLPYTAETLREATAASGSCVWLRQGERLVPAAISPPQAAEGTDARALVEEKIPEIPGELGAPIWHQGELLGALTIAKGGDEPATPADRELLDHLASQAGQVLRNAKLNADLQARLAELALQAGEIRLSRQRIVAAQDDERRALERNIHDGAQQHLVALAVKLKLAKTLASRSREKGASMLAQLGGEVQDTLSALRDLAAGVYPAALEEKGVAGALEEQVKSSPLSVLIQADGLRRYPPESEATVYFCCLEALQNVVKYADATQVQVTLGEEQGQLSFRVEDDGRGFDATSTAYGSGMRNMADRVAASGGVINVTSTRGAGTVVEGRIPVSAMEPA
ncbi:MAG: histidine kinase [Actinomycetota bacterium]|nr:histidine kinase [Actinomycetota bacterium]